MKPFSLHTTVKSYPSLPYEAIKNDILGKPYQLSLVFVGPQRAQTLNHEHRNKTYVPNVLSFPLDDTAGEIFITPAVAKREAAAAGHTFKHYVGFLYIHGLLHLKGFDHSAKMERLEQKFMKEYKLT